MKNDFVEAFILLPKNLFYNTILSGIIMIINKKKIDNGKSQILLINTSKLFEKGRPKNYLLDKIVKD